MAEVYAGFVSYTDDQIGAADRLPRGVRTARQHDHRGRLRQRRQRRGRPERLVQREQVLQQRPRHDRGEPRAPRRARQPDSYNHYNTGWAWAFDTPFPYWKRFAGYEGGVADMCIVSWPKGIEARGEVRDQYVHAVDVVPTHLRAARHRAARRPQGLHAEPDRGRELRAPRSPTRPRPGARRSSTRCSACARSTTRAGSRTRCTRRSPAGASSTSTSGSSTTSPRTARSCRTSPPSTPRSSNELKSLWFVLRRDLQGAAARRPHRARDHLGRPRPQPSEPRDRYVYYPGAAEVPESVSVNIRRRSFTIAAAVDLETPEAEGVLFSQGGAGRRPRALPPGRAAALHLQLARRARADRQLGRRRAHRAATSSRRSSRRPATTSRR